MQVDDFPCFRSSASDRIGSVFALWFENKINGKYLQCELGEMLLPVFSPGLFCVFWCFIFFFGAFHGFSLVSKGIGILCDWFVDIITACFSLSNGFL